MKAGLIYDYSINRINSVAEQIAISRFKRAAAVF